MDANIQSHPKEDLPSTSTSTSAILNSSNHLQHLTSDNPSISNIISDSSGKHCEFCLIAEFDIDRGSTLSFQYPNPIQHDNQSVTSPSVHSSSDIHSFSSNLIYSISSLSSRPASLQSSCSQTELTQELKIGPSFSSKIQSIPLPLTSLKDLGQPRVQGVEPPL